MAMNESIDKWIESQLNPTEDVKVEGAPAEPVVEAAPVAAAPAPVAQPAVVSKPSGDFTRNPLVLVSVLAVGLVVAALIFRGGGAGDGGPGPEPASPLVYEVRSVFTGPGAKSDAAYLAKVCDATAARLQIDWGSQNRIDTRGEAVELLDNTGYFAVNGVFGPKYSGLPNLIKNHFKDSWEQEDGKLKAGDLTDADKQRFLAKWKQLRDALERVR